MRLFKRSCSVLLFSMISLSLFADARSEVEKVFKKTGTKEMAQKILKSFKAGDESELEDEFKNNVFSIVIEEYSVKAQDGKKAFHEYLKDSNAKKAVLEELTKLSSSIDSLKEEELVSLLAVIEAKMTLWNITAKEEKISSLFESIYKKLGVSDSPDDEDIE